MSRDASGIRLVLADVDGTLVTHDKVLTDRAKKAVLDLKTRGIRFAVTSGRPPVGMKMLIQPLAIETPIAGFNGGVFVNPDLSVIEEHTLPEETARKVLDIILKAGLDPWVYTGKDWYLRDKAAPHAAREESTVQFPPKITDDLAKLLDQAAKIVGVCDDKARMAAVEKQVKDAVGKDATAALSQPYYLDITNKDANKGGVVMYLARKFGLKPNEIATMGDMPNDVSMFAVSGFSIAMGNASDEVKSQASATTDSNEDEGFAKALETHFLKD